MKKKFLFFTTSSFALESHFLPSSLYKKVSFPIKKTLFAGVLAMALGCSSASFGMDEDSLNNPFNFGRYLDAAWGSAWENEPFIPSFEMMNPNAEPDPDPLYLNRIRAYKPSADGKKAWDHLNELIMPERKSSKLTPSILKGLKEFADLRYPNNTFSDEEIKNSYSLLENMSLAEFTTAFEAIPLEKNKNIQKIVTAIQVVNRDLNTNVKTQTETLVREILASPRDESTTRQPLNPTQARLQKRLQQKKQLVADEKKPVVSSTPSKETQKTTKPPVAQPLPKQTKKADSEKTALPKTQQNAGKEKVEVKNTSQPISQVPTKKKVYKEDVKALPSKKSLVETVEAKPQAPLEILRSHIASPTFKQKFKNPTLQVEEKERSGPPHALCITYKITLSMQISGKKKGERKVAEGAGATINEAKNNAAQNLLDLLEGKAPIVTTMPAKKDTSTPLTVTKDKKSPIMSEVPVETKPVDIYAHPLTFEVKEAERQIIFEPEKKVKTKKKKPKKEISNKEDSSQVEDSSIVTIDPQSALGAERKRSEHGEIKEIVRNLKHSLSEGPCSVSQEQEQIEHPQQEKEIKTAKKSKPTKFLGKIRKKAENVFNGYSSFTKTQADDPDYMSWVPLPNDIHLPPDVVYQITPSGTRLVPYAGPGIPTVSEGPIFGPVLMNRFDLLQKLHIKNETFHNTLAENQALKKKLADLTEQKKEKMPAKALEKDSSGS